MAKRKRELTEVEKAERVLAEMLNEAGKRKLRFTCGEYTSRLNPTACCALGALTLARKGSFNNGFLSEDSLPYTGIVLGNDYDSASSHDEEGETLGYAIGRSYRDALLTGL